MDGRWRIGLVWGCDGFVKNSRFRRKIYLERRKLNRWIERKRFWKLGENEIKIEILRIYLRMKFLKFWKREIKKDFVKKISKS